MGYTIKCGVRPDKGYQIIFDSIKDLHKQAEKFEKEGHFINAYVKDLELQAICSDEYGTGMFEWYLVGGNFLNYLEPLCFRTLESYKDYGYNIAV